MRAINPGHVYEVANVDGPGAQTITFVRRRDEHGRLLPEPDREPGILTQELLRVAIDRTLYLMAEDACGEDVAIVNHLRDALRLFESRAARRTIEKMPMPEQAEACAFCHHLLCSCGSSQRLRHEVRR